ncbi:hypothetical protein AAIH74_36945, partial [Pseudomonas aeruginosa]
NGFARIVSELTHYSLTIIGLIFAGFVGIGINLFRKAGAVVAGVAFLLSWIVLFFTIGLFDKSGGSYNGFARIVSELTHYSLTIIGLIFAGFVGIGINLFRKAGA